MRLLGLSQETLNRVFIFWLTVVTVIFAVWIYRDYTTVTARNERLAKIYGTLERQQAEYQKILDAEKRRLGLEK